jgi:hypothetical protein
LSGEALEDELFQLLKTAEKAEFAIDCLTFKDAKALQPPRYIRDGLSWFQRIVGEEIAASEPKAAPE